MSTEIIGNRILSIQVCSDLTDMDKLLEEVERLEPCGISYGWILSNIPEHKACTCASDKTKKHYIFLC